MMGNAKASLPKVTAADVAMLNDAIANSKK